MAGKLRNNAFCRIQIETVDCFSVIRLADWLTGWANSFYITTERRVRMTLDIIGAGYHR